MKKIQLTESQARRAIRKWLFEFATDSGVSHRASTDDKIAGKLGDDREDQPASMIPQEIPIMATSQMSTQLTVDMPPVEDPDFIPGTVEELGRSVDVLSRMVPHSEIEWFYDKMQELADEAIEKGNKIDIADGALDDNMNLKAEVNPQKSSQDSAAAANESWNRWSKMILESLSEARRKSARERDFARKWAQGDRLDLYRGDDEDVPLDDAPEAEGEESYFDGGAGSSMGGEVIGGEYMPSQADLEDMGMALDRDIDELPGFDRRRHRTKEEVIQGGGEDAKLRELVDLKIFPNITTMSGIRKMIRNQIDPIVHIWFTANDLSQQMSQFINSTAGQFMFFDALTCSKLFTEDNVLEFKGAKQIADALVKIKFAKKKMPKKYLKKMAVDNSFLKSEAQAFASTSVGDGKTMQDLLDQYEELKDQNREVLMSSGLYSAVMSNIVVAPILRRWAKELKAGNIDISSSKNKGQVSWQEAGEWIDQEVLSTWNKMGNGRKAKKVEQAMTAQMEFHDALEAARDEAEFRAMEIEGEGHEVIDEEKEV